MIRLPGRRVRHTLLAAGAATAFLLAVPAAPANATPVADLDCTITVTSEVHPGEVFGVLRPLTGTSNGLTGTAICTGTVDGQPVTGPGQFGVTSHEVGDCGATQTVGTNHFVLRLPTAGGTVTVPGVYQNTSERTETGFRIVLFGDLTGTARVLSTVGDCLTEPLTQVTVVIEAHIAT